MYAVVYQNRVIVGPMDWNRGIFQGALSKQGVTNTLPRVAPADMPLVVAENATIHIVQDLRPQFNPMVEYLYGPLWNITPTVVEANYQVIDSPIEAARVNFRNQAAEQRWKRETAGTKCPLQGQEVTLDTSRDGRNIFVQALMLMQDAQTLRWKFPEGWFEINKQELGTIVAAGASYIQSCFDWENNINTQIAQAETKQQLLDIESLDPATPHEALNDPR